MKIGFMQGRLTEKNGFFPQTFPQNEWEKEFEMASTLGFSCMEWMFNADGWEKNPIITDEGIEAILNRCELTGIKVSGICVNYYMKESIYDDKTDILSRLINSAKKIGCKNIILPLFEASDIETYGEDGFAILEKICNKVVDDEVQILLETDISMEKAAEFCNRFSGNVGICYDIGNATGLGKDAVYEIEKYGQAIKNVHLKDKKKGGTTVLLGMGDAPFAECFRQLEKINYQGCFILESYYEKAVEDTKQNFEYIKDILGL
ncbi:MAG: sugar phosphate isomerase/epimerase [Lachnospiraceae bacterium]|nr:sugar phosphate isomerase/epimerase [Lachnospiraceae bacterium]